MKSETIAIHCGYETEPTTHAVAVPIYQTVAYAFDCAEHGAALFNLEAEGYRYSRISNPTTEVLERRVAALEGGVEALCVSSGQAALNYAVANVTELGCNIVSVPQLYGTTHTLFAHVLSAAGRDGPVRGGRPAGRHREADRRRHPRGVLRNRRQSGRQHLRHRSAGGGRARHGVPLIVDNTVATPILMKPIDYGADIVVHSLTKFMGGHGTTLGGAIVDSGRFPWKDQRPALSDVQRARCLLSRARLRGSFRPGRLYRALPQRLSAHHRIGAGAASAPSCCCRASRRWRCGSSVTSRTRRRVAEFLRRDPRVEWVNYAGFADSPYHALAQKYLGGRACSLLTFGVKGGFEAGTAILRRPQARQTAGQHGRREIARLPSGLDDPSADVGRGSAQGRRAAGDDPAQHRHRARRRHHRRSRSGARRGAIPAHP